MKLSDFAIFDGSIKYLRKPLLILLFGALSLLKANAAENENATTEIDVIGVTEIELSELDDPGIATVPFYGGTFKYFADETTGLLVALHPKDATLRGIAKTVVEVAGTKTELPGFPSILIRGIPHDIGETSISITVLDAMGEPLPWIESGGSKALKVIPVTPLFKNDAIVLGLLVLILAIIFYTSTLKALSGFYKFVPALLLCYFLPSLLNSAGIISGDYSNLYFVASRYLLPACLVLLCLSIDLKGIVKLGPKAGIMFVAGTIGIVVGGPVALLAVSALQPDLAGGDGPEAIWRGLSTVAGSWIGGGANQTAMKEIYGPSDKLFSAMVTVDVIVANIWMAFLLYGAGVSSKLDKWLKADNSAIESLRVKMEDFSKSIARVPNLTELTIVVAIGVAGTALAHFGSDSITPIMKGFKDTLNEMGLSSLASGFFWLVVIATTLGLILSFTKLRNYEGAGASRIGSLFIYILVATIGMKMDVTAIFDNLWLFFIGIIWMIIHVLILMVVAKLIKAPFFFVAVGSQANVGGAASAPIVASAFSPVLAPVGVLLAVLGYALGTYGAIICAYLMQSVS